MLDLIRTRAERADNAQKFDEIVGRELEKSAQGDKIFLEYGEATTPQLKIEILNRGKAWLDELDPLLQEKCTLLMKLDKKSPHHPEHRGYMINFRDDRLAVTRDNVLSLFVHHFIAAQSQ